MFSELLLDLIHHLLCDFWFNINSAVLEPQDITIWESSSPANDLGLLPSRFRIFVSERQVRAYGVDVAALHPARVLAYVHSAFFLRLVAVAR
jgi:hypothetical protein